jgi:uncharacterized PurR-regulated membrane protein YhhQ (DUF165 family)
MLLILAYIATIPAANWMIGNVGTVCVPNGPCLIPVFPGIMAPSGVLMIGAALLFRDLVQRRYGAKVSLACILAGAVLSFGVSRPSIAIASACAFLVSELADFSVYTPLYKRRFLWAVGLSGVVGAVVDSSLFLWLAFGSLSHLEGQLIGKFYATALFVAWTIGRRRFA